MTFLRFLHRGSKVNRPEPHGLALRKARSKFMFITVTIFGHLRTIALDTIGPDCPHTGCTRECGSTFDAPG